MSLAVFNLYFVVSYYLSGVYYYESFIFGVAKPIVIFHVAGVWMIASYEFLVFHISTDGLSFLFRYDWDSHMVYGGLGDLLLRRSLLRPRRSDFPFTFSHILHGLVSTEVRRHP